MLSSVGIMSLIASCILVMLKSSVNVHSGEILIYPFLFLIGFVVVPASCFIKVQKLTKSFSKGQEQSVDQKLAILLTEIFGFAIGAAFLVFIYLIAVG